MWTPKTILTRSIEDAKDIYCGYLPSDIVTRAQLDYVSPWGVSNLWGKNGYRFVMSRKVDNFTREIIATILVSHSKDLLFFFTSKYHNIKYSSIEESVDFNLPMEGSLHKWFDKFAMPPIKDYRPPTFNQIANFVVEKVDCRKQGYSRKLIESVIKYYSKDYIDSHYGDYQDYVLHSQPLICGKGFFQIADPSWYHRMVKLGFKLRLGCESFYIDRYWDPLIPIRRDGKDLSNVEFNNMFDMPALYTNQRYTSTDNIHLLDRIPEVVKLSNSGYAKLKMNTDFGIICFCINTMSFEDNCQMVINAEDMLLFSNKHKLSIPEPALTAFDKLKSFLETEDLPFPTYSLLREKTDNEEFAIECSWDGMINNIIYADGNCLAINHLDRTKMATSIQYQYDDDVMMKSLANCLKAFSDL